MLTGAVMLPAIASVRPGWPSLNTITPIAPAATAFCTFTRNVQVPRWMSAIEPDRKSLKSDASQPEVDDGAGEGGTVTSTGTTFPVTSPVPEKSSVR